jgi:p21-activated kinase 1
LGTDRRVVRQPRKREMAPSEVLQLKQDESPLFSPENPKDLFRNFKKIGEGGVGTVYLALSRSGEKVALKNLDVSLEQNLVTVEHEIRMMRSCSHHNIVTYHGSYIWEGQLWVCMEYMDGGSLTEMISICKMTEPQIAAVCRDVLQGLYYLHSFNRIHRDIKVRKKRKQECFVFLLICNNHSFSVVGQYFAHCRWSDKIS